jgi:hypothetical protein
LRKQLRELMDEDATDIVDEIRAHILDKTSGRSSSEKVSATLAALGTPEELAGRYRTEELLRRAQLTHSPLVSLRSLSHWATLSFAGIVIFVVSVFGYALGGALVIFAALKATFPRATGLWKMVYPDGSWGLNLSFSSGTPPNGKDILGWWILPIGLFLGGGLLFLTFRFGTWSLRKFWRPRVLAQPDASTNMSSVGGI